MSGARDVVAAPLGALRALLPGEVRAALDAAARRLQGEVAEDEWGFDEGFTEAVRPLLDFLYSRWWRVRASGVTNVAAHGPVLLVANHAGVLPWDAAMIATAIRREHPLPRHPRFAVLDWAFELPFASVAVRRFGGVPASPYNALRLLEQEHLVLVFPEGARGLGKPYGERYRLARFGRGGFVELALRSGAPIVPCAVVGSEEIYPKLGELPALARLLRTPYAPVTPTFPLLGPLGLVPLPSRWRIEFCPAIDLSGYGPDAAEDRNLVLEISEAVRQQIQLKLYENLVHREGAFI